MRIGEHESSRIIFHALSTCLHFGQRYVEQLRNLSQVEHVISIAFIDVTKNAV